MTTAVDVWAGILDDLEARLERVLADLETGTVTSLPAFVPPAGVPPLPVEWAARATEINERNERVLAMTRRLIAENPPPPARKIMSSAPQSAARFEFHA